MAGEAAVPVHEGPGPAVVLTYQRPFHGGLTRVEQGHQTLGDALPVHAEPFRGCPSGGRRGCGRCRTGGGGRLLGLLPGQGLGHGLIDAFLLRFLGGLLGLALLAGILLALGLRGGLRSRNLGHPRLEGLGHRLGQGRIGGGELFELFLAKFVVHLAVGDALVAVDTGIALLHGIEVLLASPRLLPLWVHGVPVVAVAAFPRVGALHGVPDPLGQGQPFGVELLGGIHGAQDLVEDLVAGLDLTDHLVDPGTRHMAVGTGGWDAASVGVVHRANVFVVDVVLHLVAGDAELLRVGRLHGPVEPAPDQHTDHHKGDRAP